MGQKSNWSESEIVLLKEQYPFASWDTLLSLLPGRNQKAIMAKANKLSLTRAWRGEPADLWSDQEIEVLKENYSSATLEELFELLPGRTKKAIEHKARKLGLSFKCVPWSAHDENLLKQKCLSGEVTWSKLFELFPDRSLSALYERIRKLGLPKPELSPMALDVKTRVRWSTEDDALLREKYPNTSWSELLSLFPGRNKESIQKRAKNLGVPRLVSRGSNRY